MVLKISIGNQSTTTVSLDYSKEEWERLTGKERAEARAEAVWDVVDCWDEEEK